jgi:hypothetical protein
MVRIRCLIIITGINRKKVLVLKIVS